jgi:hypothetical protein
MSSQFTKKEISGRVENYAKKRKSSNALPRRPAVSKTVMNCYESSQLENIQENSSQLVLNT